MPKKAYKIYRGFGTGRELIGNLYLETIIEIHGNNIAAICDMTNEVTVNGTPYEYLRGDNNEY
jgi:hypothetical protein